MLDNPEYMEGVFTNLVNWKSCTALFVNMRGIRYAPATVIEPWMESHSDPTSFLAAQGEDLDL